MEPYGIIYRAKRITPDPETGVYKVYVGQTVEPLWSRKSKHKNKSKLNNTYFNNALNKYGVDGFQWDILLTVYSKDEIDFCECWCMDEIFNSRNRNYGYNTKEGGSSGSPAEETRLKISQRTKGRKVGEEGRRNMSISKIGVGKGRKQSDEWIKKRVEKTLISLSNKTEEDHKAWHQKTGDAVKGRVTKKRIILDNKEVIDLYFEGLSCKKIALKIGKFSKDIVQNEINRVGLPQFKPKQQKLRMKFIYENIDNKENYYRTYIPGEKIIQ